VRDPIGEGRIRIVEDAGAPSQIGCRDGLRRELERRLEVIKELKQKIIDL
jgi:hypothetical protein